MFKDLHEPAGADSPILCRSGDRSDDQASHSGLLRSIRLLRLFRSEQTDPERFYAGLAEDAVRQVAEHGELSGRTVVDVGGGGGWFTAAFRARGAHCYLFEPDPAELSFRTAAPTGALVADGYWLPVRDGGADVVFSSNVLEHVPDPMGLIEEMSAARGTTGNKYPWGSEEDPSRANVSSRALKPVKSYAAYPEYQMAGNAWEMVEAEIKPGKEQVARFARLLKPPPAMDEKWIEIRGGSFNTPLAFAVGYEWSPIPERYASADIGFRCAKSAP